MDKELEVVRCINLEEEKNKSISPWGVKHLVMKATDETYRTNFRRYRDKILYTGGFRRLQDKTQVIAATKSGDHRTRLTHTMEVEQIATSIADALGLNPDLVSAIALGHDVGHTPFGHAVEALLNKELELEGGFSHAVNSVSYVSKKINCDDNHKEFNTNIRDVILEGILKHDADIYEGKFDARQFDCNNLRPDEAGLLEMQVVYWADKIAYLTHDLDDFLKSNIYTNAKKYDTTITDTIIENLKVLIQTKKINKIEDYENRDLIRNIIDNLINDSMKNINENIDQLGNDNLSELFRKLSTNRIKEKENQLMEERQVEDVSLKRIMEIKTELESQKKKIRDSKELESIDDNKESLLEELKKIEGIRKESLNYGLIINFNDKYRTNFLALRKLLNEKYIFSPEIARTDAKAKNIAKSLFKVFVDNEHLLPLNIQREMKGASSKNLVIANYIASMTDKYAEAIFHDLNAIGGEYFY